ncbi:hypothetical protein HPB49_012514 [Dermacentor silvarum]|uniref:Uncharacterized protein n=1 Tax=Dermacentor silvarum TaxID=543639 RepID=A0ACB8C9B4_DERSI|nr:hypothetical protein HPB49_012514 [Dermacentor silvarum]
MGRVKQTPVAAVVGSAAPFSSCRCAVEPAGPAQKRVCGCLLRVFPEHGYPGAPKASLFAAPTEDELRKKWERNLRRAYKPLTESSAVCERHFELRYILRDYVHIINGTEVRLPRGKPSLAPGAVPSLLPECASYLSVAPVKERPERKRSVAASAPAVGTKPRKIARTARNEE